MPHSSILPRIDVPDIDIWALLFERHSKPFPDTKAIYTDGDTGRSYSYAELLVTAVEFGKGLKALWKWHRGDVLAFYAPNNIDIGPVTAGCLWAGGVACPANPLYTLDELAFQLKDSAAKALVTISPLLKTACEAAKRAGIPQDRIILIGDGPGAEKGRGNAKFQHFSSIKATAYCSRYARTKIRPKQDLALLVYSSGTTGTAKGVCLNHFNIVANLLQMAQVEQRDFHPNGGPEDRGDRLLGIVPFFHIYGLACCVLMCILSGIQLVVMSRFDMEQTCRLIQQYKITYSYVPPPVVLAFGKHPVVDKYDLASLKMLHCAAAPLTRDLTELLWNRLRIPVKQGFGMSETSPGCYIQTPDEWAKFMGSVGKMVANMEAKIVDSEGKEVPTGEEGELWLRGPNIFGGYLNQPEKTRETFSEDGWFKTGDIFKVDKHENYYCVDRLKELIKYKGFQVPPAELEGLLIAHHDIADVCVIGVEDKEQATEVPRAYVQLKSGAIQNDVKAKEIVDWLATKVSPHKRLRGGIRFVEAVPKSQSGKILRRVLRDQAKQEGRKAAAKL